MSENSLPSGWVIKMLGELGTLTSSKRIFKKEYVTEGIPFYRSKEIKELAHNRNISLELFITKERFEEIKFEFGIPKKGDILLTAIGTIGEMYIVKEHDEFYFKDGNIMWLKDFNSLNTFYLKYALISFVDQIKALSQGSTYNALTIEKLKTYEIPVPPLPEQKRIVKILDESFAAIEKAKANAEQNLKNAKELFESYLQSVFTNRGEGWEQKILSEICEVKDGTHDSPRYIKDGIPFVTQKNIRQEGLSLTDTKYITDNDHNKFYKRSNVSYGDILISMIGANRGMACIVDDKRIFSIKNVGLIKESKNINKHFLLYYLKSSLAMKYVKDVSKGGAQEFVGLTKLRSFPIPYPQRIEQQTIVKKLDTLSAETIKLESIYQQKLNDLEELKKSILRKAFNGELTNVN